MSFDADPGASPPADPGDVHGVAEQILARLEASPAQGEAEPTEPTDATDHEGATTDIAADAVAELAGEPLHDVVVDGRTQRVALSELRKVYSRQQDYSRKTAALAEQRRAVEAERRQLKDALGAFIHDGETVDPVLAEGRRTDWEKLAAEQPQLYAQRRAEFDRRQARLEEARALRASLAARAEAARAQAHDAFAGEQRRALLAKMPELGDPARRKALAAELSAYAADLGFSGDEQARILDHRLVQVFHDAMLHRRQQGLKDGLQGKRVKPGSRTQAPMASREEGARRSGKLQALKRNALRTGRVDDVVDSILAHLEED